MLEIGSFRMTSLNNVSMAEILECIYLGFHEFSQEDNILEPDIQTANIQQPKQMKTSSDVSISISWRPIWSETLKEQGGRFPILEYKGMANPPGKHTADEAYVVVVCKVYPPGIK